MSRKFGAEKLAQDAADFVYQSVIETHGDDMLTVCESPIERLLLAALIVRVWFGTGEHIFVSTLKNDQEPQEPKNGFETLYLYVKPQAQLEDWRVDFIVYAYDHRARILKQPGWRRLIVECDGHDFHERTKEQAKRDRSRDRKALLGRQEVMRFTGSEIWNDPWGCAGQIIEWATRSYG